MHLIFIFMQRDYVIRSCLKIGTSVDCRAPTSDQVLMLEFNCWKVPLFGLRFSDRMRKKVFSCIKGGELVV